MPAAGTASMRYGESKARISVVWLVISIWRATNPTSASVQARKPMMVRP